MQISHDAYLPVDLTGGLFAEGGIRRPTSRTDPFVLRYVVDHFDGFKGRVVPSAMPWTPGLLTSTTFLTCDVFAYRRPDRLVLLGRGAKDQLGKRYHLLGECVDLAFEFTNPCSKLGVLRLEERIVASLALCLRPPTRCLDCIQTVHDYQLTLSCAPCPVLLSSGMARVHRTFTL